MSQVTLRGLLKSCDKDSKKIILILLDREIEKFTFDYLNNKSNPIEITPLSYNNHFYVKLNRQSKAYLDKNCETITSIENLIDQVVNLSVKVYHFNFRDQKSGKKVRGWNLTLINMYPHHYS